MTFKPQIRTNLEDEIFGRQLDLLLAQVPGSQRAAIVNLRFQEACLRAAADRPADAGELSSLVALTSGLFGAPGAPPTQEFLDSFAAIGNIEEAYLCFREETLLLARLSGQRALVICVSANLNQGGCGALLHSLTEAVHRGERLADLLDPSGDALVGAILDLRSGALLERHEGFRDAASLLSLDDRSIALVRELFVERGRPEGLHLAYTSGEPIEIRRAEIATVTRSYHWVRVHFDPEHIMMLSVDRDAVRGLVWAMVRRSEIEVIRAWVDGLLRYGVPSMIAPFPETQKEFLEIVDELRNLDEHDLLGRLNIGGFTNYTMGEGLNKQRCQECIYYLPNVKWCDLPELPVPVEPEWWCRLWKI